MSKAVIRNAAGKPFSKWKPADKFAYVWEQEGLQGAAPETEYVFDSGRRWRFDYAWPAQKVAVEIQGFGWGHQAQQHMAQDNEKANVAIELGWRVFRFDSRLLGSRRGVSDAVEQVCRAICFPVSSHSSGSC